MLLLRTCHIGEVQCGLWHDEHYKQVRAAGVDMIPDRIVDGCGVNETSAAQGGGGAKTLECETSGAIGSYQVGQ